MKKQRVAVAHLSLPKGGGAIQGIGETFQTDEFAGTSSLSIPIPTPPCRNSEPHISIDYDSGAGNGVFGPGFALSIPAISRKTSHGLPRYDEIDIFILSAAEDLVPINGSQRQEIIQNVQYTITTYRPRVEGLFALIEHWTTPASIDSHWRVMSSENVTSLFGTSTQSRISDPEQPDHIFQWLLTETFDARGNHTIYEYVSENLEHVPATLSEINRSQATNTYIRRIAYGNDTPFQPGQSRELETWHFEVIFDYGEYLIDPPNSKPYQPVQSWPVRSDAFSHYNAGFEIRTRRLCQNVLIFHRFEELGPDPVLVHATRFHYQASSIITLLQAVESIGYRFEQGQYQIKNLPLLEFQYTAFQPIGQTYERLLEDDGGPLPAFGLDPEYQFVDLYGEGLPGILYSNNGGTFYWEPEGPSGDTQNATTVRYASPQAPGEFPLTASLDAADLQLIDLTGDGQLDLAVTTTIGTGYYEAQADHTWRPFRPLPNFPTLFSNLENYLVDVTGNGLADIVHLENNRTLVYPLLGKAGFGPPLTPAREDAIPYSRQRAANEVLRFADLFGSGMQHLVHITNGRVECWPSLGYGRFGKSVLLDNAPYFGPDLDASRLFLADLDGSGTADIIYAYPDHLEIFLNQSGNAFSNPLFLPLPTSWDRIHQIQFADVKGTGTNCLLFSENVPQPRHWCYDFCQGQKPYLLKTIDNNLGAQSTITYRSSTSYYLADKQKGLPWIGNLPFPVQVVARIEHVDAISGNRLVSAYTYHHGYYDGIEREFRGFGLIERQDAETVLDDLKPTDVPPIFTRTWYHTGAWQEGGSFSRQYEQEYFQQDTQAHQLPDSVLLVPSTKGNDAWQEATTEDEDTWREAARALKGHTLRVEVFAPTALPDTPAEEQSAPYTVTETNYCIRLLQARGQNMYAVYSVHSQETLSYDYERDPHDPRTDHSFILNVDDFGNVLRSCTVNYPRRQGLPEIFPEQLDLKITLDDERFSHQATPDFYLLDIPQESRSFEIKGLPLLPPGQLYFSFSEMASYLAIEHAPEPPFARLLQWNRYYYWDPSRNQAYSEPGQVSAQALLTRVEEAVFSSEQIEQVFTGALVKADLDTLLGKEGGYQWRPENGYWWNPGLSESYLDATGFFLTAATTDVYGNATTYAYDPHPLLIQSVTDALKNQVRAIVQDYQTLSPQQVQDINGNISEVLFDPLGMVIVTSYYGSENGQPAGFVPLKSFEYQPASDDIFDHPEKYLKQASSYFYYDYLSWVKHIPVHAISLEATAYPAEGPAPIHIAISYSDGFGRAIQSSAKVEPGEATIINEDGSVSTAIVTDRWLATGRTTYNNKGLPVKQYEPYYIDTPSYIDNQHLNTFGVSPTLYYDPLDRLIRVDTPKGFFTRTLYSAWVESSYDENDTILDSDYYKQNIGNLAPNFQEEHEALQKASLFADTPHTLVLDNPGRTVMDLQKQEGIVAEDAFVALGLTSGQSLSLWQDLQMGGWLDWRGALTPTFQPTDPDFQLLLSATFAPYRQQIIALLRKIQSSGSFLRTHSTWDIQGNQLASADPRLYAAGKENFRTIYTMTGVPLQTSGADTGVRWQLTNVLGNPIYTRDGRATVLTTEYDALHRLVAIHVQGGDGSVPLDHTVERMIYGDSLDAKGNPLVPEPEKSNLRGQLHIHYDQAGVVTWNSYTIQGLPLDAHRQLRQDYKQEANWSDFSALLQTTIYNEQYQYDALGRITAATDPAGNVSEPLYHLSGRLKQVQLRLQAEEKATVYVEDIEYNAKSQREKIVYGNGLTTTYTYEPTTFRLIRLLTTRSSDSLTLQDLTYTYDPVGNVTHISNGAQEPIFNANQQVRPKADYTYDALYHLIQATGREHPGLSPQDEQRGDFASNWIIPTQPINNGQALENYLEQFTYDVGENLSRIQHLGTTAWTRTLTVSDSSNRAVDSTLTGQPGQVDSFFDQNGNQKRMVGLPALTWNYRNNIANVTMVERQKAPADGEYYVYDSAGKRVRKVTERYGNGGTTARVEETLYLGAVEIRRVTLGSTLVEERQMLHIMDDERTIATRLAWTQGAPPAGVQNPQVRYQLDDHLGSAQTEIDAEGQLISYEEYFPYGGTALIAGRNALEVELKRYRYSGKERDSVTGLYYYGVRYYAPWLGRWISPDPAGRVDGLNLYMFVLDNPILYVDNKGMAKDKKKKVPKRQRETNYEQLNYLEDSRARFARARRRAVRAFTTKKQAGINLATAKLVEDNKRPVYITARSVSDMNKKQFNLPPGHSEKRLLGFVKEYLQDNPHAKVEWVYTEREPCGEGCGLKNCRKLLMEAWEEAGIPLDNDQIFFSSLYSDRIDMDDKSGLSLSDLNELAKRHRNNEAEIFENAISKLPHASYSEEESEGSYDELYDSDFGEKPAPKRVKPTSVEKEKQEQVKSGNLKRYPRGTNTKNKKKKK